MLSVLSDLLLPCRILLMPNRRAATIRLCMTMESTTQLPASADSMEYRLFHHTLSITLISTSKIF